MSSIQFDFHNPHEPFSGDEKAQIPAEMRSHDNWLLVNAEDKSPVSKHDPTSVSHLLSFAEAVRRCGAGQRVAFQFSGTPFLGIDWDDIAHHKEFTVPEFRQALSDTFDTYTEWSQSGTGLHQIVKGRLSSKYGNRADLSRPEGGHVEMYDEKRYFVITGDRLPDFSEEVESISTEVRTYQQRHFSVKAEKEPIEKEKEVDASAQDVLKTLEEYAKSGHALSDKAQKTLDLWESVPERGQGHGNGASEADASFMAHALWWAKGDTALADECWRASKRFDKKAERTDYREKTLRFVAGNSGSFNGRYVRCQ